MHYRCVLTNLRKWSSAGYRKASVNSATTIISDQEKDDRIQLVRPYEAIPGPKALPIIGNIFRFLPFIGEYHNLPLNAQMQHLHENYGDIVKLEGLFFREPIICLFKPEFCEQMYRFEGPSPRRHSMECFHYYRQVNKDKFKKAGVTTSQGREWTAFRSKVNQPMMQPRTIKPHVSQIDEVANEFIDRIRGLRDPQTSELPPTFNNEMNKWALESICAIALDHRMGILESNLDPQSEPQLMINAVHDMFDLMFELEILPSLWKYYNTRKLKHFFQVLDFLYITTAKYVKEAKKNLNDNSDSQDMSMLQRLLRIDEQTAQIMVMDMLVAGIDTTGNTAGWMLYYVSKHPEVQEKLRAEIDPILKNKDSPVTYEALSQIPYVKACIKETLRLSPVAIGILRTMIKDVEIGGYAIPEGTNVIAIHSAISKKSVYFPEENEFIPERWLRGSTGPLSAKNAHPFAYSPFGFGPRTCIGRRFAELEMETLLMKMIRNFKMEWHHEPMQTKSRYINTMGSPLQLKVIDR